MGSVKNLHNAQIGGQNNEFLGANYKNMPTIKSRVHTAPNNNINDAPWSNEMTNQSYKQVLDMLRKS